MAIWANILAYVDVALTSCIGCCSGPANRVSRRLARQQEATDIDKSMSSIGNVISALANQHRRVPYGDSKMTRLLQAALGGESRTVFISHLSPNLNMDDGSYDETLSTLRLSQRVRMIVNTPKPFPITEDVKTKYLLPRIPYSRLKQHYLVDKLSLKVMCRHVIRGCLHIDRGCDLIGRLPLSDSLQSYIRHTEGYFPPPINQRGAYPWFYLTSTKHCDQKDLQSRVKLSYIRSVKLNRSRDNTCL